MRKFLEPKFPMKKIPGALISHQKNKNSRSRKFPQKKYLEPKIPGAKNLRKKIPGLENFL